MILKKSVINVIPYPKEVYETSEIIHVKSEIMCSLVEFNEQKSVFIKYLSKTHQVDIYDGDSGIIINKDLNLSENQYKIKTENNKIYVDVVNSKSLGYAFATLLQLFRFNNELLIPNVIINDWADKDYRGLMVDLARQFHPYQSLYKYVDLCYFYKISYLHLHFADDQNYTLPNSKIKHSTNRFYTKLQLKELNGYAAERGITIIPEIEIPGHSAFLLSNTDGCFGGTNHKSTMCIGKEDILTSIFEIIKDVCDLFPNSPYIHIGGDEVDTTEWKNCALCNEYMKEHNLKDYEKLYCYFVGKAAQYVIDLGKRPIVWEGFNKEGADFVPKQTIVSAFEMYYNMPDSLIAAGFDIINTSWKPLYLTPHISWPDVDIHAFNIYEFKNWIPTSKGYKDGIKVNRPDKIIGSQICSWENNYNDEFSLVARNLAALSERVWTVEDEYGELDYDKRRNKLKNVALRFLD